jgi:hypothetical protein
LEWETGRRIRDRLESLIEEKERTMRDGLQKEKAAQREPPFAASTIQIAQDITRKKKKSQLVLIS